MRSSTVLPVLALQDTEDGRVRLQAGFILRERAGTDYGGNDYCNKK